MAKQSRLEIKLSANEVLDAAKEALATHLDELAAKGETLTPDDLREAAARLRVEATSA